LTNPPDLRCTPLCASPPPPPHQVEYLREAVGGRWGDKVMTRVSSIIRHVPPGSTHPDCMFPQRAGSHLTQVRPCVPFCVCEGMGVLYVCVGGGGGGAVFREKGPCCWLYLLANTE